MMKDTPEPFFYTFVSLLYPTACKFSVLRVGLEGEEFPEGRNRDFVTWKVVLLAKVGDIYSEIPRLPFYSLLLLILLSTSNE
jgi:hypothetical protein